MVRKIAVLQVPNAHNVGLIKLQCCYVLKIQYSVWNDPRKRLQLITASKLSQAVKWPKHGLLWTQVSYIISLFWLLIVFKQFCEFGSYFFHPLKRKPKYNVIVTAVIYFKESRCQTSVQPVKYSSRFRINVLVVWLPAINVRISRDVWRVLFMRRVTLLFLPHSKSLTGMFTILDKITLQSSYKTDLLLRYLLQGNM